jgi:hypothetical protein
MVDRGDISGCVGSENARGVERGVAIEESPEMGAGICWHIT